MFLNITQASVVGGGLRQRQGQLKFYPFMMGSIFGFEVNWSGFSTSGRRPFNFGILAGKDEGRT
jgi:hypothetical protein